VPAAAASEAAPPAAASAPSAAPPPQRTEARSRLETYMQGLACGYLQGEVAYVECATRLASELAEVDAESLTLSLVDDSFFVLLKAFTRSASTGQATLCVVPLLHAACEILRGQCYPRLKRLLNNAGSADPANERFLVAANSMQCAAEYTQRLSKVVQTSFAQRFASLAGMAEMALSELASLGESCDESADKAMRRLAAELMPIDWLRVDFETRSFRLAGDEHAEAEAQQSFERGLLQPLRAALERLREPLRAQNLEMLVKAIASALASQIEVSVLRKRFDEGGAILLCEHTRKLTDALSELVAGSVRNEFARLNQVTFLLNAGSVQEAAALLLSSSLGERGLTKEEAARVLSLRTDLPKEELAEFFSSLGLDDTTLEEVT
jgi:hypothetical protein